jgi:hypothetical protein
MSLMHLVLQLIAYMCIKGEYSGHLLTGCSPACGPVEMCLCHRTLFVHVSLQDPVDACMYAADINNNSITLK